MYKVSLQKVLRELGRREVRFANDDEIYESNKDRWHKMLKNINEKLEAALKGRDARIIEQYRNSLMKTSSSSPRFIKDFYKQFDNFYKILKKMQKVEKIK